MKAGAKIKCKQCGDIIQSKFRHDFQQCRCGAIFVDGGKDYFRCGWPGSDIEDWIEEIGEE
jgi:hypothetical protein